MAIWQIARDVLLPTAVETTQIDIVDLVEPANEIAPEKTRLIGVRNNTTTEETVATPKPPAPQRTPNAAAAPQPRAPRATAQKPPPSADSLPEPAPHANRKAPATALSATLHGGAAASMPEEYFRNYKKGPHTYVNVLKHPDVDFFVEMKRSVRTTWNPSRPLQADLTEELYRRGTVGVVLAITVDARGNLVEKSILKPSGIPSYDQEALRAFNASAPFFAPSPKALAIDGVADDVIHMSWALVTYVR